MSKTAYKTYHQKEKALSHYHHKKALTYTRKLRKANVLIDIYIYKIIILAVSTEKMNEKRKNID